ncbi:c-type cytochrome [Flavobacterium sp.]|uniref:c-type cytochrome n=1 Tax=Flavobacterium sp. TaxID=239 RepID=UPI0038FC91ED
MMRNLLFFAVISLSLLSCKKESSESFGKIEKQAETQDPVTLGTEIFEGKGACITCHKANEKQVGPSVYEIAKIYKDKNGDMISFLKGEAEPLVDPSQYDVMKVNLQLTKTFSYEELKALEAYFYTTLK